jgi:hypothetical protein
MKNNLTLIGALFLSGLMACSNKYKIETVAFQKYLSSDFHEKIPEVEHTYLLIATFRCSGCVENSLAKIREKINTHSKDQITILTFDPSLIPANLQDRVKILLDRDTGYENIGISIANLALIKSNKGKIDKIRMINLDNTDKIVEEEFQ